MGVVVMVEETLINIIQLLFFGLVLETIINFALIIALVKYIYRQK